MEGKKGNPTNRRPRQSRQYHENGIVGAKEKV